MVVLITFSKAVLYCLYPTEKRVRVGYPANAKEIDTNNMKCTWPTRAPGLSLALAFWIPTSVSEIKLFDYAPAWCTPSETVHPGSSPCTLLICSNDKWLKKCAQSGCTSLKIVHPVLKMSTPGTGCMVNFGHCNMVISPKRNGRVEDLNHIPTQCPSTMGFALQWNIGLWVWDFT